MQGRFNLNSLVAGDNNQYSGDPAAIERFERLLEILELEPKWAKIIADWIDTDTQENFPDGAEDSTYTSEVPPYRTANMPITRVSELYAIAGFDREMYLKLEPHVTALPMGTPINLCTASPDVLDALVKGNREFTLARENVADLRKQRCHPTVDVFKQGLSADQQQELIDGKVIDVTSSYFRSTVWVTIGTTQFTLYSLLYRTGTNQVRPILRSFGTT
jgi:general secretion pathway protein K